MWRVEVGTGSQFWYIHNPVTGGRKKIGPVTLTGKNYYDAAVIETRRRNLKDYGQNVSVAGNGKYDANGNYIEELEPEYRIKQ